MLWKKQNPVIKGGDGDLLSYVEEWTGAYNTLYKMTSSFRF